MQRFAKTMVVSMGMLFAVLPLAAQATRTWVSGVGDDANPCSRTAPCKTFAGAISKTAAGGEINVLDPGGFGTVTITKSITIDGGSALSGVLSTGVNGIIINAGVNDTIILRNLDINGAVTAAGTDQKGIYFIAGLNLIIDNCHIYNMARQGIGIQSTTNGAKVSISNTLVNSTLNNGIVVAPPGVTNRVVIDNVRSVNNTNAGLVALAGAIVQIRNSVFSNNLAYGMYADNATVDVDSVFSSNNGTGINAQNVAVFRISNATITGNTTGLSIVSGAVINSYGDNQIAGNSGGNSGVAAIARQ